MVLPDAAGGRHQLKGTFLAGRVALAAIPRWFLLRFVLWTASYGTGSPSRLRAPLLLLGALIGPGLGKVTHLLPPRLVPIPAIVRAPLTGIVVIVEMTGNYALMLPLVAACFRADHAADAPGELPNYENLLKRDLMHGGAISGRKDPIVLEVEIEPDSPFACREVRELGLPQGCVPVSCRNGAQEWMPTASTRLKGHVRVRAMIAPDANGGARRAAERL